MTSPIKLQSFGIIPLIRQGDDILTVIVKHKDGHWGLPKGTPESGEDPLITARRELEEETSISQIEVIKDFIFSEKYSFEREGIKYEKEVIYFLGWAEKSSDKFSPADDIVEVKWLTLPEAKKQLTYKEARSVIDKVIYFLTNKNEG